MFGKRIEMSKQNFRPLKCAVHCLPSTGMLQTCPFLSQLSKVLVFDGNPDPNVRATWKWGAFMRIHMKWLKYQTRIEPTVQLNCTNLHLKWHMLMNDSRCEEAIGQMFRHMRTVNTCENEVILVTSGCTLRGNSGCHWLNFSFNHTWWITWVKCAAHSHYHH